MRNDASMQDYTHVHTSKNYPHSRARRNANAQCACHCLGVLGRRAERERGGEGGWGQYPSYKTQHAGSVLVYADAVTPICSRIIIFVSPVYPYRSS